MFSLDDKVVMQFSGGRDALACLYLLREHWDRMVVMWCDTGDALPETHEQMAQVAAMVSTFMTVKGNQPAQIERWGLPADVVSVWGTPLGKIMRVNSVMSAVQTPFACCEENIWRPLDRACKSLGATVIVRGQRNDEGTKGPIRSGHIQNGVKYVFPLEEWTEGQVNAYLQSMGVPLPKHYGYFNSSLDCGHCTAFLSENAGKMRYLREHHPDVHADVEQRLGKIMLGAATELQHVVQAMKE
jgi:phosphoadenosine phosphosulfate reductase